MLGTLDDLGDWRLQMGIWKYAIIGKILDQDALVAEYGHRHQGGFWDQTKAALASQFRDRGRGLETVPDWWALPHLPLEWMERALRNDGSPDD